MRRRPLLQRALPVGEAIALADAATDLGPTVLEMGLPVFTRVGDEPARSS